MRETCGAVEVAGRITRYALLRASSRTPDTVYVDPGGPGVAALSGHLDLRGLRTRLGNAGRLVNLLVVEEPWVRQAVRHECRVALTSFYRAVRGDTVGQQQARDVAGTCAIGAEPRRWGHSPDELRQAVTAIVRAEHLALGGVIAMSFGSVRWEHLAAAPVAKNVAWVVLMRPFPVGERGTDLIAARASAIRRLVGRAVALSGEHEVGSRSLQVTRFDQLSAQVELAYDADPADRSAVAAGRDVTRIGQLSDALWLRYGTDQISAGYLAYLDEACLSGAVWPAAKPIRTVDGVLGAGHLPCTRANSVAERPGPPRQPTCIVASPHDAVTPQRLIHHAYAGLPHIRFVVSDNAAHRSLDGLETCLKMVGAV